VLKAQPHYAVAYTSAKQKQKNQQKLKKTKRVYVNLKQHITE
jgi:hypothetical protein